MSLIEALSEYSDAENVEEEGSSYEGESFDGVIIRSSVFRSVSFSSSSFHNASITDTVFESCDFSNVDFSSCSMLRVKMNGCRLTGAVFLSSRLRKLEILDASARYTSFDKAAIEDCLFRDSDFPDSSFSSIKHRAFSITHSDLSACIFRGTALSGLALKDSRIDGISLSDNLKELKDSSLDIEQSLAIIRMLGVNIVP